VQAGKGLEAPAEEWAAPGTKAMATGGGPEKAGRLKHSQRL
jgi:hypothetical protein